MPAPSKVLADDEYAGCRRMHNTTIAAEIPFIVS
jgi:hypothetical protein